MNIVQNFLSLLFGGIGGVFLGYVLTNYREMKNNKQSLSTALTRVKSELKYNFNDIRNVRDIPSGRVKFTNPLRREAWNYLVNSSLLRYCHVEVVEKLIIAYRSSDEVDSICARMFQSHMAALCYPNILSIKEFAANIKKSWPKFLDKRSLRYLPEAIDVIEKYLGRTW